MRWCSLSKQTTCPVLPCDIWVFKGKYITIANALSSVEINVTPDAYIFYLTVLQLRSNLLPVFCLDKDQSNLHVNHFVDTIECSRGCQLTLWYVGLDILKIGFVCYQQQCSIIDNRVHAISADSYDTWWGATHSNIIITITDMIEAAFIWHKRGLQIFKMVNVLPNYVFVVYSFNWVHIY